MNDDGRDSETLSGSQAPTISGSPPSGPSSPPVAVFRPSLPIGEKFGSYRLLRPLGKGGMGEVYEAEHEETRRRVALKVLSRGLADPTDRARFLREGRLAASISHPNSVYIYGTEEIEGTAVIAMELVPGGTLKDRVERNGPMPPRQAVDAILHVVQGLEAAASKGVLHRDIKPSNCFVDRDGTVKIGDFGLSMSTLSRPESHLTATGTSLVTAFVFRGGPSLGLFGIAVVGRDGAVASRFRTSLRSLVGWSPYWITALAAFGANRMRVQVGPGILIAAVILSATAVAVLAVWDAWSHPERGFQDRIAGTFLVPR